MNQRQAQGQDFNALLTQYAIERFLYRLSISPLAGEFVLKGAMLFRVWLGNMHRPTKDLDLLGHGEPNPGAVTKAIRQVIATTLPDDDGLTFDSDSVIATEIREEQEYGGIRVKLVAMLSKARIPMQIDVGFGDAITPDAGLLAFPTLLEMEAPQLMMYPPETVVAEKLEARVTLGATNSRMKDYYDLMVIFKIFQLTDENLAKAISATFERRKTAIPKELPPGLTDEFGADESALRLWREFLRRLQIEDVPMEFSEVVTRVSERVWPLLNSAARYLYPRAIFHSEN